MSNCLSLSVSRGTSFTMVLNSRMASCRMVEFGSTQEAVNWKAPSRPSQERVQVNCRGTGFVTAREVNNRPSHGAMNAGEQGSSLQGK